jgi:hypothetical protein
MRVHSVARGRVRGGEAAVIFCEHGVARLSIREFRENGRVVGGFIPASRPGVDGAGLEASIEWSARQNQIYPQTLVATKAAGAIIPPRKRLRRLLESAKGIDEPELEQAVETGPLGVAAQDLSPPRIGIVHIRIRRCDIEIAEDDQ